MIAVSHNSSFQKQFKLMMQLIRIATNRLHCLGRKLSFSSFVEKDTLTSRQVRGGAVVSLLNASFLTARQWLFNLRIPEIIGIKNVVHLILYDGCWGLPQWRGFLVISINQAKSVEEPPVCLLHNICTCSNFLQRDDYDHDEQFF